MNCIDMYVIEIHLSKQAPESKENFRTRIFALLTGKFCVSHLSEFITLYLPVDVGFKAGGSQADLEQMHVGAYIG